MDKLKIILFCIFAYALLYVPLAKSEELMSVQTLPPKEPSAEEKAIYLSMVIRTESPWCWDNFISEFFIYALSGDQAKTHEIIEANGLQDFQKKACLTHLREIFNRFN